MGDPLARPETEAAGAERLDERIPEPFPLVRYYLIASVLLVLVAFVILNLVSQRIERNSVVHRLEEEAATAIQPFAFDMSLAVSSMVSPSDDVQSSIMAGGEDLDRATLGAIRGDPIVRADLLALDGRLMYSTDPSATVASPIAMLSVSDVAAAARGATVSKYAHDASLVLFNGEQKKLDVVITAVPLNTEWSVGLGSPVAVLVSYRDVTSAVAAATSATTPLRIGSVAGTMLVLFLLLFWIVARGQRYTAKAREELAAMLLREREMRGQLDRQNVELQEANRAKSQFLSLVSHELKTPLTSILVFSSNLSKKLGPGLSEREARQLDAVARNGKQLKALIEDLLDVSAAESGKLQLRFEEVRPAELARDVRDSVQPLFDAKRQPLVISAVEVEGLALNGDRERLQQVLTNLLSNASKYSPEGSPVQLQLRKAHEKVLISVSDRGIGISEEDQKMLFSTFFRTAAAVASGAPGTGLGLVIVRSIVEGHGGTISVKSGVGMGTTVTVELPLYEAGAGEVEVEEQAA